MSTEQVLEWFIKHDAEHNKFENIPEKDQLHILRDVCAMLYLHRKLDGAIYKAINYSIHGEIYFTWQNIENLTENDVMYLVRCGVYYDIDKGLYMLV